MSDDSEEKSLRETLEEASKEVFERARDEAGRFTKAAAESVDDGAVAAPVATDPLPAEGVPPVAAPPSDDPFPQAWKKDYEKQWSTLPKEVKDYIRTREADMHKTLTAQDEDRSLGKSLRGVHQAIQPYMPMISAEGATAEQAVQTLLTQAYVLRHGTPEQKRNLILSAVKAYGIDITEPTSTQGWVDPQVADLQKQLSDLKDWRSQYEQSAQMQEKASIDGTIAAFAADPKHSHFANPKVQSLMGHLMASGAADSMDQAYEQACWSITELRSTLLTEQQAQDEAKRAADAKAKAEAARKASGSVRGSSSALGSTEVSAPKGSLRDELRAQFAAAKNRI